MFWTENLKYMCENVSISSNAQTQGGKLFTVPKQINLSINTYFFICYCEGENYSKIHLKQESFKIQMCMYMTEQCYSTNIRCWTAMSPPE